MTTKKQQRRRQKLNRHEYEDVYVDDEGNVVAPDEAEELVGAQPAAKASRAAKAEKPVGRGGRTVEPPSWRRTLKRGLLFFPLMLITVMLLGKDLSLAQQVTQSVVLMGFFLPFSYFMDTMVWRSSQRRLTREKKP